MCVTMNLYRMACIVNYRNVLAYTNDILSLKW